jgi:16S rRNA (adenine1518-N6/adenine1519-N6)-dimethyltransferase
MSVGHRPKKSLGQHFLHDRHIIHKIVSAIHPEPDDFIVEIGPGQGALTQPLLAALKQLYAIEFDRDLVPELKSMGGTRLHILQQDVLRVDFKALALEQPGKKLRVVGNLPYNISTPILFHLLQYKEYISDMYFMLQKEVVERICAPPGSKIYGRLSVMVQVDCEATPLFTILPGAFTPPPQVDSMCLHLKSYLISRISEHDRPRFEAIVKQAFQTRRKTLKNALKNLPDLILPQALSHQRAEQLSPADFIALAKKA